MNNVEKQKMELSMQTQVSADRKERMEKESNNKAIEEMREGAGELEGKVDSGLMDRPAELPVGSSTDRDSNPAHCDYSTNDLDSTGDSDRLVIAEEESPAKTETESSETPRDTSDTLATSEAGNKREAEETASEASQDTDSEVSSQSSSLKAAVTDESNSKCISEPKVRRRRKPAKVLKHEVSEEMDISNYGQKFDQNFNSLEAEPKAEPKPKTPGGGPPETTLVNSFVAQAMKLWYDEELPKSLASPSKDIGQFVNDAKQRAKAVSKNLMAPATGAPDMGGNKENQMEAFLSMKMLTKPPEFKKRESSFSVDVVRSGVAPDDQYYSTPSPTVPSGTDYWTPDKSTPGSQACSSPMATPMLAKAMQSLRAPSPAVSPSLASDQESPANNTQKLYFCTPCNKTFTFRTNLTRHQRTFHGRPCRRRTRDSLGKDDSDRRSEHSVSSEDADHMLEKRESVEERGPTKVNVTSAESNYGRFSPSVVSEAKIGRYSPSIPSFGASDTTPHKNILPPYLSEPGKDQDYIVITPKEEVSCSLCLSSFGSPSHLAKHEPTCRGIDRSTVYSDTSGAIDLSKPKVPKQEQQPQQQQQQQEVTPDATKSYKPKFHYTMADMINPGLTSGLDPALATPFLPHPAALHSMTAMMSQHPGAFLPASLEQAYSLPGVTDSLPPHIKPSKDTASRKPYKCSFCTKKYSSYKSLTKHTSYVHKINMPVAAPSETDMSAMVALATAEMKMLSEPEGAPLNLSGEAMGRFPCKICGQMFPLASLLRSHIHKTHLGFKDSGSRSDTSSPDIAKSSGKTSEWVCSLCNQNFASKRNLYRHLSHVHKVDPKKEPQSQQQEASKEGRVSQHSPAIPVAHPAVPLLTSQPSGSLLSSVMPVTQYPSLATPSPSHLPALYSDGGHPSEPSRGSVHHLQDVVERVLSSEENEGRKSPVRRDSVKLPPKKAIMEEYKQEQEKKTKEEKLNSEKSLPAPPPVSSPQPAVLNLSQSIHRPQDLETKEGAPEKKASDAVDLSAMKDRLPTDMPYPKPKDIQSELKQEKFSSSVDERKDYYPNPFSAILNLSQTYLRKLLNESPIPSPPPHSESYSFPTIKDKENNIEKDAYSRMPFSRLGRDFPHDTTSKLREMLTNKGVTLSKSDSESSRPCSRPSSGCASPIDNAMFYDRRPLMLSSENQPPDQNNYNMGVSDISPLGMNSANMMALKQKLMDVHSGENNEWRNKAIKKRKTMDSVDLKESRFLEDTEPAKKKLKASENRGMDLSSAVPTVETNSGSMPPNVESIKTGEFPAIAIGKRHICGLCGASFTFQTNLTRHQRKLHGKPFVRKSSMTQKVEALGMKEEMFMSSAPTTITPAAPAPSPVAAPPTSQMLLKQEAL